MKIGPFEEWWTANKDKSRSERNKNFMALNEEQKRIIQYSLFADGWGEYFLHNHIARWLDRLKQNYNVDLINLRIQALKQNRSFIIDKKAWDIICNKILFYDEYVNMNYIFGGLVTYPHIDGNFYLIKRNPNME